MSSPYVVLENRPLDQWKVTELKEELKRRKLMTKGLKDDLVKRLDEAVRAELAENHDNCVNDIYQTDVPSDDATVEPVVTEKISSIMDDSSAKNEALEEDIDKTKNVEKDNMADNLNKDESLKIDNMKENLDDDATVEPVVTEKTTSIMDDSSAKIEILEEDIDKTKNLEKDNMAENLNKYESLKKDNMKEKLDDENRNNKDLVQQDSQNVEINKGDVSNLQPEVKPDIGSQVVEVSQVKSDFISIDTISITENKELKDNVITDDVKLELDVKPEMVQPSFSNVVLDDGKPESLIVNESHGDKVTAEEKDTDISESINVCKKNDSGDVGSPEKLNLDDDSMEEDPLESKQIDSKSVSQESGDISEKTEAHVVKEDRPVDVMAEDTPSARIMGSTTEKSDISGAYSKRKLTGDQEADVNSEVIKRQRRWNSEGIKAPEQQTANSTVSATPKDAFQAKRAFSRSDSSVSHEEPKERVVPPSSKPPTTSLRIDHFLRPFTLKAVQELLGKTGTVVSFWMDHIKTHCYVTYSSVEEAVETRNAVYNLQWPANGGRLLIAEFVDPAEVNSRTEAPLPSPATHVNSTIPKPLPAATQPPQKRPPPATLLPPPPLSLPPPPPLPEKVEPPIMTLDDLFRKTRATPRIYYLPLSDEQVAEKLKNPENN